MSDGDTAESGTDRSETPYKCFEVNCPREFESLDEMVAVPGMADMSPRHFCEPCAERLRRGPPMTDGGTDRDEFDGIREIPGDHECESCGFTDRRDHFDKVGEDLRCPACGSLSVCSVDTDTERDGDQT